FSSRRRHTRCLSDWSSDVCSSDLPLLGLKFKNTSGMPLTQGPITVFDGSNYAGDARILDLQPNEERLLSYAIDLGTEVEAVPHRSEERRVGKECGSGWAAEEAGED